MDKSLDAKLAQIHADPGSKAFILADAKDADMAYGIVAPGPRGARSAGSERTDASGAYRSLADYREHIRENVRQGLLDIMLMSVSTSELLTIVERLFDGSTVTPAVRANDTTDIHLARGGTSARHPSLPFRTALLDHAQCGRVDCDDMAPAGPSPGGRAGASPGPLRALGANLGLYSVTFNNDAELDRRTLEAYREFRVEAERKGFRHFLEVFDPNAPARPVPPKRLGGFINDQIVRALAGVASAGRPIFLKIVYHGPRFMEELASYDPHLVPGILGGASGTTCDAFKLLEEARAHGARAALFGRKINNAEHQPSFIQFLRWIADGQTTAEEAVRAYHGVLQGLGLPPHRPLHEDLRLTNPAVGRSDSTRTTSLPPRRHGVSTPPSPSDGADRAASGSPSAVSSGPNCSRAPSDSPTPPYPVKPDGIPDFAKMTSEQRLAYHKERLDRMLEQRGGGMQNEKCKMQNEECKMKNEK